ncbi:ankyrin repeat domain-containing protein [Luteimonas sp. SJ-92]|uniref:Ankyrin repeat domain-containing protein n=1 Tax=Luteimonas salinisoli TaxID=2752307 RepID=A0A853J8C5_9GAMM|nr:M56 family metallopeptidase [Luteimonas salinisoli]NZA24959.1 ankyrin repeat domain-containing protein [Luteimonas salinisoli]
MSDRWPEVVVAIGVQHLWQSAVLLLLALLVFRLRRPSARARSWMWLCVLLLAAVSPLAVLLPGDASTAGPTANAPLATIAPAARATTVASVVAGDALPTRAMLAGLQPIVLLAWVLGTLWSLGRLWAGWYRARRLRDTSRSSPHLERLVRSELPANATVRVSTGIRSPMVVGLAHPCILVPRALVAELSEAALRDVLRHEIAHVRRGDMAWSLVQHVLVAVYWWNPFLRLIASRLDLAREMACDAFAAARTGVGRHYANSLLRSAEQALLLPDPLVLASGIFAGRAGLHQRIEGLLEMDKHAVSPRGKPALLLFGLMLASSVTLTLAATPRMGAPDDEVPASLRMADARLLVEAAGGGRLDEVRALLRRGADIDAVVPGDGTALIAAARAGDLPMITALLRMGADVNRPARGDGNPLIMAAMGGHREAVALLLDSGASVDAIVPGDETALINAARHGHLPVVERLVAHGADVNLGVRADFGQWRSPLNQARGREVREYLIGRGAVPGNG